MKPAASRELSKSASPPTVFASVTPAALAKLNKLDIHNDFDLVLHLPLRYEDETRLYPIKDAPPGRTVLVEGTLLNVKTQYRPRPTFIAQIQDKSGILVMRLLHFYGSQVKALVPGVKLRLLGEVRLGFLGAEMVHPKYRVVHDDSPLSESLTPVYPTTAGFSQASLRKLIKQALEKCDLTDSLPQAVLDEISLPDFAHSVQYLHEPPPDASQTLLSERTHPAWERLKFDELLAQQLSMRLHYRARRAKNAPPLKAYHRLTQALLDTIPFPLTRAQQRVLAEISHDMTQPHPMQRLLQGDVGSGKTIVAALAACQAIDNGYQAALMAPTEILAEQHYRKLAAWLVPLGVEVAWLSASLPKKDKQATLEAIAEGRAQLAIGTHALFQEEVGFHKLGLAIIDEQHRFGVHQRLALRQKGKQPHQLMMSATPIPRTLAMSYYADLDVSVIDELPPGRTPVATKLVADTRREEVIERIRTLCLSGAQAYWVCPLIEESEKLQLKAAEETCTILKELLPELNIGLVHGRLHSRDKTAAMAAFQTGEIQLLVATTVIEVGVDVPNASLMVIEHAERMGLSQLHQLRGRVGRGTAQSACILLYQNPLSENARARLKIIFENTDGFEIARQDLLLRGPGEILGARQSGAPMLRFADLEKDVELLEAARHIAGELLASDKETVNRHLQRWLGGKEELLKA